MALKPGTHMFLHPHAGLGFGGVVLYTIPSMHTENVAYILRSEDRTLLLILEVSAQNSGWVRVMTPTLHFGWIRTAWLIK